MAERQHILRWGGASGIVAALILTIMMVVGLAAGPDSTKLLQPTDPVIASKLLAEHADTVQAVVVLDDLFALAYTGAFFGLAALVWMRSRWLAIVGMLFALATAILDFSENARLLAMAQGVGADVNLTDEALRELHIITQLKYSCSHVATFLLAIGLPKRDLLSWIVTVLLFLFPVLSTIAFAYEPAIMARLLLMWLLLALGGWLTLRESRKIQGDH